MRRDNPDKYWWSEDGLVSIALVDIWYVRPEGVHGTPDYLQYPQHTWWVFPNSSPGRPLKHGEADSFDGALRAARYWIRQNQNLVYGD